LLLVDLFRYIYAIDFDLKFLPETEANMTLPPFTPGRPAAEVDASLRQSLAVSDRARECAVLWFAEVQRRQLHRALGFASLQLYATEALGFSDNRYWQFKRLADDLDRLPVLKEAATTGRRELEQTVRQLRRRKS
jgi:hypothetical protein